MHRSPFLLLLLAATLAAVKPAPAWAQRGDERARLVAERETLTRQFAAEEAQCRERFAVTACVDDIRARRRQALAPLRARELELNDHLRRERAAQRQAAREARLARAPAPPSEEVAKRAPVPASPASTAQPLRAPPAVHKPASPDDGPARQAAERAQSQQKRLRDAQQTQADIAQRLRERQASGKKSDPLPPPDAASAPAR